MKTSDACLFLAVGALMWAAPLVAPGHFPLQGPGLTNPSALWLQFMGWINAGLGGLYILCERLVAGVRAVAIAAKATPATCAELLRPALPQELKASLSRQGHRRLVA